MGGTSSYLLGGALLALIPSVAHAFYLPGAAPHNYEQGDPVNVYVNALTPMLTSGDDSKLVWFPYYVRSSLFLPVFRNHSSIVRRLLMQCN